MKNIALISFALLACVLSLPVLAATVSASLDRDQAAPGETVQLTLRHEGRGGGDPDLAPLNKDFDVLDRSSSSSIQLVNGDLSSQRLLQLTLAPKHSGALQVPPLSWDGQQTAALTLNVSDQPSGDQAAAAGAGAPHVFLSVTLDQQQPYVQGAVVLTVQVHTDERLYQAALDLPGNGDVLVQQLPGQDRQTSETRNGRSYEVIERKYLLQPQRSGALSLDGPVLDGHVVDLSGGGIFQNTRPLRVHGDPIKLEVRPRPAAASGRDWLPATKLTLEEAWRPDNTSVHAGEPLTLHLRLRAEGMTAAQLPDLGAELSLPEGLKAYPDQAKLDTALQGGAIVGSREQDIALIASSPGHYQLPALHLSWWDTKQEVQREVVLPERTLDILPATGGAAAAPPAPVPATPAASEDLAPAAPPRRATGFPASWPWPWISLALGLLWLLTMAAWWLQRRRAARVPLPLAAAPGAAAPETGNARQAFRQACADNDPQAARRGLLAWARGSWPQNPPAGLNALSLYLDDPRLTGLLQQLDRACYSGGSWQGGELARALSALPGPRKRLRQEPQLGNLYP